MGLLKIVSVWSAKAMLSHFIALYLSCLFREKNIISNRDDNLLWIKIIFDFRNRMLFVTNRRCRDIEKRS